MTLATAFSDLHEQLNALHKLLRELHTTVAEDKPLRGDVVLVERLSNAADDVCGLLDEALAAVKEGRQAVEGQTDLDGAQRKLTTSSGRFSLLLLTFSSDMFSYDRLLALNNVGRERGGEWRAWAGVVGKTLDRLQQNMYKVNQAIYQCWQELAERNGATSISVQTSNVGQKYMTSDTQPVARQRAP